MIVILKHISFVVLQEVQCELNIRAEEYEVINVKQEQDFVKIEEKVKDSVLLCIFIYLLSSLVAAHDP